MKTRIIFIISILLIAISGWCFAILQQVKASSTNQVFDHSDCQYPTRLTNPPDGCDNTDPACPIQKDGTELCSKATDLETQPTPVTFPTAQPVTKTTCQ